MQPDDHVAQALHNQESLGELDAERFPDWAVTMCFYASVHWVEAAIKSAKFLNVKRGSSTVKIGAPIKTESLGVELGLNSPHQVRKALLLSNRSYFNCASAFQSLMEASHDARYRCYRSVTGERVTISKRHLETVRQSIAERIAAV